MLGNDEMVLAFLFKKFKYNRASQTIWEALQIISIDEIVVDIFWSD
jgi:hypothetical protein